MDKLQPVLKQIFWICTGFVILLAVGGWWMALGTLHEQIQKDSAILKTAEADSNAGGDAPNAVWTSSAKKINLAHQEDFSSAEKKLHSRQVRYRTYPKKIAEKFKSRAFATLIENSALRGEYGKLYQDHFLEQLSVLHPFIVQDNEGLIDVAVDQITQADVSQWPNLRPTSLEVWKAQEDLWLLRSLFESISSANEGAERLSKAPVRQLLSLTLRGGSRNAGAGSAGNASGGGGFGGGGFGGGGFGGGGGDKRGDRRDDDDDRGRTRGRGQARPGAASHPGMAYEGNANTDLLTEEFGADTDLGASTRPAAGGGGRVFSGGSRGDPGGRGGRGGRGGGFGGGDPGGGFGGGQATTKTQPADSDNSVDGELVGRYVDNDAEYRTRAFLLHVRVKQGHIAALLAELTNSSFPVEIVRVNVQFSAGGAAGPRRHGGIGGGAIGLRGDDDDDDAHGGRGRNLFGGGGLGARAGGGLSIRRRGGRGDLLSRLANKKPNAMLARQGEIQRSSALSDPNLADVRIAGLLTIYRTKEENEAAALTAELEASESPQTTDNVSDASPGDTQPADDSDTSSNSVESPSDSNTVAPDDTASPVDNRNEN